MVSKAYVFCEKSQKLGSFLQKQVNFLTNIVGFCGEFPVDILER